MPNLKVVTKTATISKTNYCYPQILTRGEMKSNLERWSLRLEC